jgi:hypothetical protein
VEAEVVEASNFCGKTLQVWGLLDGLKTTASDTSATAQRIEDTEFETQEEAQNVVDVRHGAAYPSDPAAAPRQGILVAVVVR